MYVIIEVDDHLGSNGATITELKFLDFNGISIPYTIPRVYDSFTKGIPYYWNSTIWDKSKLNDGNINYTSNTTGGTSTALFLWGSSANSGYWARFVVDLDGQKAAKLQLWAGSPEGRIPKNIKIFIADSYTTANINNRDNTGLKLVKQLNFDTSNTSVAMYEVSFAGKYLFQDGTEIKTYASIEYSMLFDGIDDGIIANTPLITSVSNTFTYEFWALPQATHEIDSESTSGISGTSGQKWAIGAGHGGSNAGAGVSVGTNGISVYEHGVSYLPALLVYPTTINDWVHIAVVYENKQPTLYINGVFAKTGLTSTRSAVYPSAEFGTGAYGKFKGKLKDIRIWNYARTQAEIQADMNKTLTGTETGLIGYWKMNEGQGTIINDSSPSGNHATASGNPTWVTEKFGWITVGSFPATRSMFDQHGMTDLSIIDNNAIQQLTSDTPELLCWTDEEGDSVIRQVNITAVPLPQLLLSVGDIEVGELESVQLGTTLISAVDNCVGGTGIASRTAIGTPNSPFDDNTSTQWDSGSYGGLQNNDWIGYDFGAGNTKHVRKINITQQDTAHAVTGVIVQKSDDGTTWQDVYIASLIQDGSKQTINLPVSAPARYWRLKATSNPGNVGYGWAIKEIEMFDEPSNADIKIIVSGDSGANWKGKNGITVDISDLTQVKANGFTSDELNALTKQELISLFPNGKARFAFYLEQEKSTDIVQIDSLSINEKIYTMTPSIESLKVIYNLLEAEKPKIYVSRDDGVTWKEVQPDTLTSLEELPEGNKLRVKVVLSNGQELHALSYSWI